MSALKPLSPLLKSLVTKGMLPLEYAQILNENLNGAELQGKGISELPEAFRQAAFGVCERINYPEGKIIYTAPPDGAARPPELQRAIGDDVLNNALPLAGRTGSVLRVWLSELWAAQKFSWIGNALLVTVLLAFFGGPLIWLVRAPFLAESPAATSVPLPVEPEPLKVSIPAPPAMPTRRAVPPLAKKPVAPVKAPAVPAAPTLLPPSEVHAEVKNPDLIIITWRAVRADAKYNVYSSPTRYFTERRKENLAPLDFNRVRWQPETGLDRYWLVVTTIGDNGAESNDSEAIEVVRNPEKSGPGFVDQTVGTLRRLMP